MFQTQSWDLSVGVVDKWDEGGQSDKVTDLELPNVMHTVVDSR